MPAQVFLSRKACVSFCPELQSHCAQSGATVSCLTFPVGNDGEPVGKPGINELHFDTRKLMPSPGGISLHSEAFQAFGPGGALLFSADMECGKHNGQPGE